ncbi:TrkH family potassium uptake protein [Arthrobacter castelli]|uniref:TrkH family potassium uptake protein n=1 Tax=Arthrobacter castelli TaxID=271431 RepID=UPI0004039440|nr:potassium transporter TrkG [Arthrobacter castelli]
MAKSQPAWPQPRTRGPFWLISAARDFVDGVAKSSPARLALIVFAMVILLFAGLLSLPISSATGVVTPLHNALFTAVSAVTVTGLTVVSTALHWSFFGQLVILIGMQVGGLGILTMASLMALAVSRRLGVRGRLIADQSMSGGTGRLGEVGTLLRIVVTTSLVIEAILALVLAPRFMILGEPIPLAIWHAVFYGVSSFNNAGFTPHSDGLIPYETDLWILIPIMVGVFVGSLGFPVLMVLLRNGPSYKKWNLHTKLTIEVSLVLLLAGAIGWAALEWNNDATIGDLSLGDKVIHSVFASIMPRSGGFSLVDMNAIEPATRLMTDALMFAGGGSASTAGGIKVTTLAIMFLAIAAEARGDRDVKIHRRKIPEGTMRVAISVIMLGATLVLAGCGLLLPISGQSLDRVMFEVLSAFGTCGLSVGLSAELPPEGKYVLSALMFAGRVGTITLASALALRQRRQLFHYPDERPIIG